MKKEKEIFYHLKFWPYTAEVTKVTLSAHHNGHAIVWPVGSNVSAGVAQDKELFASISDMDQYVRDSLSILLRTGKISKDKALELARTYRSAKDSVMEQMTLDLFGVNNEQD